MNGLDLLIVLLLAVGAWRGFRQGLVAALIGLVGWLAALYVASHYAKTLAPLLTLFSDSTTQTVAAFVVLVSVVLLMLWAVGLILRTTLQALALGLAERLAGALFGVAKTVFIVLILISVLSPLLQSSLLWRQSVLRPWLLPFAPLALQMSRQLADHAWQQMQSDAAPAAPAS